MQANLSPDELDLLGRITEKEELQPFFFRKVKGLKWFDTLADQGFLSPEKNPKPVPAKEEGYVIVPVWSITEYLLATSAELQDKGNEAYAEKFLGLIRATTNYARDNKFSNYRTWWQFSKVIQNIPPHLIKVQDVRLFDYWLNDPYERGLAARELGGGWLVALLDRGDKHSHELALEVLEIIYKVDGEHQDSGPKAAGRTKSRLEEWYEKDVTHKVANKAGRVLGLAAVKVFRQRLEFLLAARNDDKWGSVWRRAIEDHEQDQYRTGAEHVIIDGFRDSLLAFVDTFPDSAFGFVGELLKGKYQTVRRLAIYCVSQRYRQLNPLVETLLKQEFFTSNYRHELWHLLKNHYASFTTEQRDCVVDIIRNHIDLDDDQKVNEGASAYWRANWLAAIKDLGNIEVNLYRQCVEIAGAEPEHPDFSSYMTTRWGGSRSPLSAQELLSFEVDELIGRLNSFKDTGSHFEPGLEGLVKALKEAVKIDPLRFYGHLQKFLDSDFAYVYELIEAYHDLWSAKAALPWNDVWEHILSFCEQVVHQNRFWDPDNAQSRKSFVANREWIVGGIARLIEDGTRSDDHAFDERLLGRAEEILLTLLKNERGEPFKSTGDAVSVAINSPRGRCLEALINLTLRFCRIEDKALEKHEHAWAHFQPTYDAELVRADSDEYEFATLVSMYLPNFLYMSRGWTLSNLALIFDHENKQRWRCAMQGYAHVNTVHQEFYEYLRSYGDFLLALDDETISDRVQEKIIQNIAIGYLSGYDDLHDATGLMSLLLARCKESELGHLIWFLWTFRDTEEETFRNKVFELWSRLLQVIDTNTKQGRKLAARLCDWISFVRVVDETNKSLVLAVAAYADEVHHSFAMLESIARISKKQPLEAYEIWNRLLEKSRPDYPDEAIREALKNLVAQGADGERKARGIVDQYLRAGNEQPAQLLREVRKINHPASA